VRSYDKWWRMKFMGRKERGGIRLPVYKREEDEMIK
jgi:hypothetical protein